MSSLPNNVSPFLCNKLDWDNDGVEKDLDAIARKMSNWEAQFAINLGLTRVEIEEIRAENHALQRYVVYDLCRVNYKCQIVVSAPTVEMYVH